MRVLIAADKFKDSLTGDEVAQAISAGIKQSISNTEIHRCAVSDGGDGFLVAVESAITSTERITCETVDPLGRKTTADFLFDSKNQTAYIELAAASGIELLTDEERDPLKTSTFGTGNLILAAAQIGATAIYIGIGGSSTNDGGIGMAAALGWQFLDGSGQTLSPNGGSLEKIASVKRPARELSNVRFFVVNDVDNPLCGPNGAAHVYGPQKGADQDTVLRLDAGLQNLAATVKDQLAIDRGDTPGAGAAGGSGYGLNVFLDAEFCSGAKFVLTLAGVHQKLCEQHFDFLITGEGKLDRQTLAGKLIAEVSQIGADNNVPVVAFCGVSELTAEDSRQIGLEKVMQIHDSALRSPAESMTQAFSLLETEAANWAAKLKLAQ